MVTKLRREDIIYPNLSYNIVGALFEVWTNLYYFDFLIENKIVLELKARNYFSRKDIDQLFSYLKSKDMKLGIIAHFTKSGVKFKRVVNI